jgi:hypothetical protein
VQSVPGQTPPQLKAAYGDQLTFSASVTPVSPFGPLHGQVAYYIDGNYVATTNIGGSFVSSPLLAVGDHTVEARYCDGRSPTPCAADAGVYYDSSASILLTVDKASTLTTITCDRSLTATTYTGAPLTPCTATVTGAGGLSLTLAPSYANNINASPMPPGTPTATVMFDYAGDANYLPSGAGTAFLISKAPSTTTLTCPSSAFFTGSALTPCTAAATGAGGLNQPVPITYFRSTNLGTATATITPPGFTGDANHDGSSASPRTFDIVMQWSLTTSDGCTAEDLDVSISGNDVSLGHLGAEDIDAQSICVHGAYAPLPSLGDANSHYKITFTYDLATWDAYDAFVEGTATGYWDSFSISVSNAPYQQLTTLSDPITTANLPGLAFIWGGSNYGDGVLECNPSTLSCTLSAYAEANDAIVPGTHEGGNYLNVVLDTRTTPFTDVTHPSYGTFRILNVVPVP